MSQLNLLGSSIPGDMNLQNSTGADIAARLCVALDTSTEGLITLTSADTDFFGVLMEAAYDTKFARVRNTPGARVVGVASDTIAIGDELMSDSAGKVLKATTGKRICGRALTAASSADAVAFTILSGYAP